jgi:murein DD-endopeptidase MepM/ murein hydrolase activator NlpD
MKHPVFGPAALLTAAGLFFCMLFSPAARAAGQSELQGQVDSAKQQYQAESQKLSDAQASREQAEGQKQTLQSQKDEVAAQLANVSARVAQAQSDLAQAQADADAAAAALAEKQTEYDDRWDLYKQQIAALQELHDGGGIAMLSQISNLEELLTFSETLSEISRKTNEILAELDTEAGELAAQKQQADETAAGLAAAQQALSQQQSTLDTAQSRLADALMAADSTLSAQEAAVQAQQTATDEAKKQYETAAAELDAYVRAQSTKYSTPALHLSSLDFCCPLDSYRRISCVFGEADYHGIPHRGADFAAPSGTPIRAAADGVVSAATFHSSYGNYVQISHGTADDGNRYDTLYAHMTSSCVGVGQTVSRGDVIGYVGSTGDSQGYHLHLELRINGVRTDPLGYIPH